MIIKDKVTTGPISGSKKNVGVKRHFWTGPFISSRSKYLSNVYSKFCDTFQVLQKQMDLELELYGDVKEKTAGSAIGKVFMLSLSSQPVDHNEEDSSSRAKVKLSI